ncbi:hypothetical protein K432DRAFT_310834, partial [Lepidopterella palustris CBS 459.81]
STRRKPINYKTDYILLYLYYNFNILTLYKRLDAVNNKEIGHTLNIFTKQTALFSSFKVKPVSRDYTKAKL